jgi:hypothetical protein
MAACLLLRSAAESVGARACVHARCGSMSLHSTVSYNDGRRLHAHAPAPLNAAR